MGDKLKPCPFCGCDPKIETSEFRGQTLQSISCVNPRCECAETAAYPLGIAFERWNRRAEPQTYADVQKMLDDEERASIGL